MKPFAALAVLACATLAGCSSAPDAAPTGHTTTVTVTAGNMRFAPDVIDVPVGDRLVVEFENAGPMLHDITFDNGAASERLNPDQSETVDVGIVAEDMDFWCSVAGHREKGMEGRVEVVE